MKLRPWSSALTALWLLALAGCATTPSGPATPVVAAQPDALAAAALQNLGTPDSAVRDPVQALEYARQASELAPQRPDLALLQLRLCEEQPNCEPQPLQVQLRRLAPGNGIVWLRPLQAAQQRQDTAEQAVLRQALAQAQDFNLYWNGLIAAATPQLARHSGMSLSRSLSQANLLAGSLIPPVQPINDACSDIEIRDPQARAECEAIAQALQRSDTELMHTLGLRMAQRMATPASRVSMALTERINTAVYRQRAVEAILALQTDEEAFAEQLINLMSRLPRESDVQNAILRWAGQPLIP